MYQALYRKYRPRRFEDVVGQEHITDTLRRQVEAGRTSHAYIFVGTRGTGKTTCAKILSRALNCLHPVNGDPCNECESCRGIESGSVMDVVEIDAASNNGVDSIRAIRDEAIYSPTEVKKRVYIIDEVHMLSTPAFNALLKILEEPPEHLVFILATTELNKVPATILSRCQHFSFRRIAPEKIEGRLKFVADSEGFTLTDSAAALLARLGDGSMRDALSLLDQCVGSQRVDEEDVMRSVGLMGTVDILGLWDCLRRRNIAGAMAVFERIYYGGVEPVSVLGDLMSFIRDMLVVRVAPKGGRDLLTGAAGAPELRRLSEGVDTPRLLAAAEALEEAADTMRDARDKRIKAELCLVKVMGILEGTYREPEDFVPARAHIPAPPAPKPEERRVEADEDAGYDAPPPWEDEDIPPEDFVPVHEAMPEPEPAPGPVSEPEPTAEAEPAPKPAPAPDGAGESGDWWGEVLKLCAGTVEGGTYTFLANRDNAAGRSQARAWLYTLETALCG